MDFLADECSDAAVIKALRLVYAGRVDSPGVILIRFPAYARSTLGEAVLKLVSDHSSELP